jgi:hypothetical protein
MYNTVYMMYIITIIITIIYLFNAIITYYLDIAICAA